MYTSAHPSSQLLRCCFPFPFIYHSYTRSVSPFAISICSNDIYLASWECPSAVRHNKSYKYQPSGRGSCNIYGGNVAVGDVGGVYGEQLEDVFRNETERDNFSLFSIFFFFGPIQRFWSMLRTDRRQCSRCANWLVFPNPFITCESGQPTRFVVFGSEKDSKSFECVEVSLDWLCFIKAVICSMWIELNVLVKTWCRFFLLKCFGHHHCAWITFCLTAW